MKDGEDEADGGEGAIYVMDGEFEGVYESEE